MKSGDTCPQCGDRLQVINTRVVGEHRVRYVGCRTCGFRPPNSSKRDAPSTFYDRKIYLQDFCTHHGPKRVNKRALP